MPTNPVQEQMYRDASLRPTHAALEAKLVEEFGSAENAPPRARRMVERSAFLINNEHQQHIDGRRAGLDRQDTEVISDAEAIARFAQEIRDRLERGEITAAETRGKLRDYFAVHRAMAEVGNVLDAEDERLAAEAELDPAAWQAEALRRGLLRRDSLPSLVELEEHS